MLHEIYDYHKLKSLKFYHDSWFMSYLFNSFFQTKDSNFEGEFWLVFLNMIYIIYNIYLY